MKFLIAGFGSIGRRHFNNLLALGEKDILFYRTDKSTLPAEELKGYLVERDLIAALGHNPDAVIIANPTAYHLDVAIPAARQGCHILLEKPISHSLERVDEFAEIVERSGTRVLVGFQFRFHPNLLKIKELLDQEAVGQVLAFRSHWGEYLPGWHPWEDYRHSYSARKELGGGVLLTLCHNFDYLRWLFGEGTVQGSMLGYHSGLGLTVEDTAEISLSFGDILGSLHLNFTQLPPKHTLEIIGSKGSIYWDYYQNTVKLVQFEDPSDLRESSFSVREGFERNELFLNEMAHFLDVARGTVDPVADLKSGIQVLDLIKHAKSQGEP